MSDKQKRSNRRNGKRKIKCYQCEFYDYDLDCCIERDIENCSRQTNINFSKCDDFLIKDKLIYF